MRQRKAKDLEKRLEECSRFIAEDIGPDRWKDIFDRPGDMYLEIGCGKGQFIIKKALLDPDNNYIGIEGQETVILRAAEKAKAVAGLGQWPENVRGREVFEGLTGSLDNLRLASCYVNGMDKLFQENSLAGVYLNFSDPWPKARHAERRLTHRSRLMDYARSIRDGGFIEFKTDNEGLFEFSIEEFESCIQTLKIVEFTRNLHGEDCTFDSACVTTEYEDKFSGRGKNINYIKVIVNKEK